MVKNAWTVLKFCRRNIFYGLGKALLIGLFAVPFLLVTLVLTGLIYIRNALERFFRFVAQNSRTVYWLLVLLTVAAIPLLIVVTVLYFLFAVLWYFFALLCSLLEVRSAFAEIELNNHHKGESHDC